MEWNGTERNGTEWNGLDGMEWRMDGILDPADRVTYLHFNSIWRFGVYGVIWSSLLKSANLTFIPVVIPVGIGDTWFCSAVETAFVGLRNRNILLQQFLLLLQFQKRCCGRKFFLAL